MMLIFMLMPCFTVCEMNKFIHKNYSMFVSVCDVGWMANTWYLARSLRVLTW